MKTLIMIHRAVTLLLTLWLLPAAAQAAGSVWVQRADGQTVELTSAALLALPRAEVEGRDHGQTHRYEGTLLREVLAHAGVQVGGLRGQDLRQTVVVHAADGYQVVFSLGELDPELGARPVWLVNQRDGAVMPAAHGDWRLVIPGEARAARWVRQVVRLDIHRPEPKRKAPSVKPAPAPVESGNR